MTAPALQTRAASEGFTLVELLVALSLLLLIASMALGSFSFGRRVWEARIERDGAAEVDAALSLLRRHLMSAVPVVERRPGAPPTIAFAGRGDSIEYVISEPGHTLPPGLYRVRVRSERNPTDQRLSLNMEIKPLRDAVGGFASGERDTRRILVSDLADFHFRYFGPQKPGHTAGWSDEWTKGSHVPRAIEIAFAKAGRQSEDGLVIPLQVPQ